MGNPTVNEVLEKHSQLPKNTCAASGFEFVAKLHGHLKPEETPLQADDKSVGMGFGDTSFVDSWATCKNDYFATAEAMALVERETAEGRFPLASLYEWAPNGRPLGWHIFVCALQDNQLVLLDPRGRKNVASGREAVEKFLENNRVKNGERDKLHLLWYQLKPPERK